MKIFEKFTTKQMETALQDILDKIEENKALMGYYEKINNVEFFNVVRSQYEENVEFLRDVKAELAERSEKRA